MIKFHTLVASVGGIGFVGKGGGTIAALVYCSIWFLLPAGYMQNDWQVIITLMIIGVGVWSSNVVDSIWGKDSSKVVIDEVAGMAIALLYVPQNIGYAIVGLVAFRFFDIVKPLGVRKTEKLPKGWGVMADDILAGIYALALVQSWIWMAHKFG
ncbi:MAG: phosphatidylglycerophosphatase A [Ferruginibacter sp.]